MKTIRETGSDRRLSLLKSALDLFSTQGYDGTTTRAVAERAGVTEALLFKHFHTKQELLRSVVEEYGPRRLFPPPPDHIRSLPIQQAIEQLLILYLDTFWTNRACLRMLFMATQRDRAAFDELRTQFGRQTAYLYTLLMEREQVGELKPGIAAAATDIISAATGGFLHRSLGEEPENWNEARIRFVSHLLCVLFHGILEPPEKNSWPDELL